MPAQALAVTCNTASYRVESEPMTQYGARVAENLVINPASTCGLVRSVYIRQDSNNFVEVGWFESGTNGTFIGCDDLLTPHVLVYATVRGFVKCKHGTPALTALQDYSFRVDNPDHDNDFVYYYDSDTTPSISLGFFATDHQRGFAMMAAERKHTTDNLRADLLGVNSLNSGGSWGSFPLQYDLIVNPDVSGYSACSWSGDHLVVKASC